jgi:hypothetical protein
VYKGTCIQQDHAVLHAQLDTISIAEQVAAKAVALDAYPVATLYFAKFARQAST